MRFAKKPSIDISFSFFLPAFLGINSHINCFYSRPLISEPCFWRPQMKTPRIISLLYYRFNEILGGNHTFKNVFVMWSRNLLNQQHSVGHSLRSCGIHRKQKSELDTDPACHSVPGRDWAACAVGFTGLRKDLHVLTSGGVGSWDF